MHMDVQQEPLYARGSTKKPRPKVRDSTKQALLLPYEPLSVDTLPGEKQQKTKQRNKTKKKQKTCQKKQA